MSEGPIDASGMTLPAVQVGGTMRPFLHGSDIPGRQIKATITGIKLNPLLQKPWLEIEGEKYTPVLELKLEKPVTFNTVAGETTTDECDFTLNKTNYVALFDKLTGNARNWVGKTVILEKIQVINPQTRKRADAIMVADVQ